MSKPSVPSSPVPELDPPKPKRRHGERRKTTKYDVEHIDWPTGCTLWTDCLTCPLSRCVYDEDREAYRQLVYREAEAIGIRKKAQSKRTQQRNRARNRTH